MPSLLRWVSISSQLLSECFFPNDFPPTKTSSHQQRQDNTPPVTSRSIIRRLRIRESWGGAKDTCTDQGDSRCVPLSYPPQTQTPFLLLRSSFFVGLWNLVPVQTFQSTRDAQKGSSGWHFPAFGQVYGVEAKTGVSLVRSWTVFWPTEKKKKVFLLTR